MSKKKTNKQKQNTRAKRKAQNAKVAATAKKTQSANKAQQPKTIKVKAAEPLSTPKANTKSKKSTKTKEEQPKVETPKVVLPVGPQKVQDLGPSPVARTTSFSYSTRGMAALCVFLVAFSLMYNVTIDTMGTNFETVTEAPTTEAQTVTTTIIETTTETITYEVTQAPTVAYTRQAAAAAHVEVQTGKRLSVPYVSQLPSYPTGCEAASMTMVLRYWGYGYSLDSVVNSIPTGYIYKKNGKAYGPSIYSKFVGDPRCTYTSATPGYGCFSPVVTGTLNRLIDSSKHVAKNITGSSLATLFKYIDEGCPVIVWSTYSMQTPKTANAWYIEHDDGSEEYFEYPRGTHVTVLYGYDNNNIYMLDPYTGGSRTFSQSAFSSNYNLLGMQAVVITKAEETTTKETTIEESTTLEDETDKEKTKEENPSEELDEEEPSVSEDTSEKEEPSEEDPSDESGEGEEEEPTSEKETEKNEDN